MKVSKIDKAITQLILQEPFFGRFLMGRIEEDSRFPTFATDMEKIYYNPIFSKSISLEENKGVIIHEVLHIMYKHGLRKGDRDSHIWNLACDLAINPIVMSEGYRLPEGALIDDRFKDMGAERIFDILIKENKSISLPMADLLQPVEGEGDGDIETKIDKAILEADTVSRLSGKKIKDFQNRIVKYSSPKISWKPYLHQFMTKVNRNDYSYERRHRRSFNSNFYLPSLYSKTVGDLFIAIDSSGSIDQDQLSKFVSEVNNFNAQYKADIEVVFCDTSIRSTYIFKGGEEIELTPKGGGGTDFAPVMQYLENKDDFVGLLYFTDGWCNSFGRAPSIPVLWVLDNDRVDFKPPFGEVISIN